MAQDGLDRRIPGEEGIWFFVTGDLLVFTSFFATYMVYRTADPALFARSQAQLGGVYGVLNTFLLLTSSWLVALAVKAARGGGASPTRALTGAIVCGALFVVNKAFEWGEKFHAGIVPTSNPFFMFYFMFTGIHLLHVVVGILVLLFLWSRSRDPVAYDAASIRWIEVGATFWHVVDLLWIVLFALLYLVH